MKLALVSERLAALPSELPAPPAILTPIRLDDPGQPIPSRLPPTARGRQAAVLVLLFPDEQGNARVLLTARVPQLSSHAGEVSFPGGSAEANDRDPAATALREAAEEVGLDPEACGLRVVGSLERFAIPVSGFRITPVLAIAERRPDCRANPDEVARIIEPPVDAFLPDAHVELEERVIRERLIRYGVYPVEGERVWGATARMLGQLGAILAGDGSPLAKPAPPSTPNDLSEPSVRRAGPIDRLRIDAFLEPLSPELARELPPASETLVAETRTSIAGLASWAPWDRQRDESDPRGFEGLDFPGEAPAELTLLAVAPEARGRGIGRSLADAVATRAAAAGSTRLLAWALADTAIGPSAQATRAFFRSCGFADLAVDRQHLARGEDRLLLSRALAAPAPPSRLQDTARTAAD